MKHFPAFWLVLFGILLAVPALNAEEAAEPEETLDATIPTDIDPEADKTIRVALDFYKGLKSATTELKMTMLQESAGEKSQMNITASIAMVRPNQFAMYLTGNGPEGAALISDGKILTTFLSPLKQYVESEAPASLDELLESDEAAMAGLAQMGAVRGLFLEDPHDWVMAGVTVLKLVGVEKIGEIECHHFRAEQAEVDWDVWFEKGEKPVMRKFIYSPLKGIIAQTPEEDRAQFKGAKLEIAIEFDAWKLNEEIPADRFAFTPPDGVKKVEEFAPEVGADTSAAMTLRGQPAPDFAIELLDGGKLELAAHKDKDVVILDFWATWCGPCTQALPIISGVAAEYKDKGVVFYAVNQQEDDADVKKFLETEKLTFPVAMDRESKVAALYKVEGIPQTVIIGKDGKIVSVHVGFDPELKAVLKKELDALLSEKK